jgi:hypothetical protein
MSRSSQSLRNEVAALLAEVEELKAKQQSRGWAYVTVDKGENRDAEIASLEARGYNWSCRTSSTLRRGSWSRTSSCPQM